MEDGSIERYSIADALYDVAITSKSLEVKRDGRLLFSADAPVEIRPLKINYIRMNVTVNAGTGTTNVACTIPTTVPPGTGYHYDVYSTPVTRGWQTGDPELTQDNISVVTDIPGVNQTIAISVYPSPTNDIVKVCLSKAFDTDFKVDVYDNLGRNLQSSKRSKAEIVFEVDLKSFCTGTYIVKIHTATTDYHIKVMKN